MIRGHTVTFVCNFTKLIDFQFNILLLYTLIFYKMILLQNILYVQRSHSYTDNNQIN